MGMASIVVSGDVLRRPRGSNLAAHLHYLIGLRKLGHEVAYLEDRGLPWPPKRDGHVVPREGLMLLGDLLRRCRVDIPVVWVDADAGLVGGMVWPQLRRRLREADLLLDIGGHCWLEERSLPRRRVLIDIEPRGDLRALGPAARQADHDLYFSNRRDPDELPAAEWLPTIPPVVPRLWYGPPARAELPLKVLVGRGTAQGGLGPAEGRRPAPRAAAGAARAADAASLDGAPATTARSWRSSSPRPAGACGPRPPWMPRSRRTAAQLIGSQALPQLPRRGRTTASGSRAHDASFLAAGRPLIVGDADLDCWLPTGTGLLTFADLDGAVEAVELVARELPRHAAAARDVAERVFHFSGRAAEPARAGAAPAPAGRRLSGRPRGAAAGAVSRCAPGRAAALIAERAPDGRRGGREVLGQPLEQRQPRRLDGRRAPHQLDAALAGPARRRPSPAQNVSSSASGASSAAAA